ncbi:PadR family transcriptional regulator [Microbacterium sp. NPDC077663]|uniref:PadR family transcriptional regulator n=1 Tax=Microbacterium sp. NPDC077663 TaxID=3364189 RepID=UPI0037C73150
MGKQTTEMLKGVLEGIVLAILAMRPAYGYEITASLRDRGFPDIAEGTVYALLTRIEQKGLVDVEKVPSEKGPPRKVYTLNRSGHDQLAEFWEAWDSLADRLTHLQADTTENEGR